MSEPPPSKVQSASLGAALLGIGLLALLLALQIPLSKLGANHDPGPRTLPLLLGACLAVGGIVELVKWWRARKPVERGLQSAAPPPTSVLRDGNTLRVLFLLGGLVVYLAVLPWAGFSLATVVFAAVSMLRLGARWPMALGAALAMVVVIHLLFVRLFKVQLPLGIVGLPF